MSLMILKNDEAATAPRSGDHASLQGTVARLAAENAALRREVERLGRYRAMAYRDPLTGLHNRRAFDERLHEECARARRDSSYAFAVIFVDLDEFKAINDTHGHAAGDRALEEVARFLLASVREVDGCYRIGGDEFAILLPDTNAHGCCAVVARLRGGLPCTSGLAFRVGLSVGVACCPPGKPNADEVITAADAAMYRDKIRRRARRDAGPRRTSVVHTA
jgi:diguanylate cyclase (GGDEF)-like protein